MKNTLCLGIALIQFAAFGDWNSNKIDLGPQNGGLQIISETCSLDGVWKVSNVQKSHQRPEVKQAMLSKNYLPATNTSNWHNITVPHYNWHKQFPYTFPDPAKKYKGYSFTDRQSTYADGWFSKQFNVPSSLKGKRIYLKFGAVAWESHIWVNGKKAGSHQGNFTGFKLDITGLIEFDKPNTLRIWVYNDFGERPVRHTYGKMFFPASNVGGIYGSVELEALPRINVTRCLITPELKSNTIEFDLKIANETKKEQKLAVSVVLEGQLSGKKGKIVKFNAGNVNLNHLQDKAQFNIKLDKPELWTPARPYLYNVYIVLRNKQSGKIVSCYKDRFGFREFVVKGNKFFLNGKRIRLYCGNIRSAGGWEVYEPDNLKSRQFMRRQIASGANTIRYHIAGADSHRLLAMADEEGLLIISEFPMFHRVFHHLAFKNPADRKVFMNNVLYEWKERLYRDYNHPSCVVWSLSNEVWTDSTVDELNEIYTAMKPLDKQNRPMSAGSGLYSFGIPTLKVKTDFWDAHLYNLVSQIPYTFSKADFDRYFAGLVKVYGKLDRPSAAFECLLIGAGRPPARIPYNKELKVDEYLKLLNATKSQDVAYLGLRHFLAWRDGGSWLADNISKKAVEEFRKETRIQGFHPWWPNRNRIFPAYKLITSPVFIGAAQLPKNQFAGEKFKFNAVLIKDPLRQINTSCLAEITDNNGKCIASSKFTALLLADKDKTIVPVSINIPENVKTGFYKLDLKLQAGNILKNHNYYSIYILNRRDLPQLKSEETIAIYQDSPKLSNILKNNKLKYKVINDLKDIKDYKQLAIHITNTKAWKKFLVNGNAIRQWVKKGNRLLIMEIPAAGSLNWIFNGYEINKDDSGFQTTSILMEPVVRQHPVFKGLTVENFDTLNGEHGIVGDALLFPLSNNLLGAGFVASKEKAGVLVFEAKIDKGSCIISQVKAINRYNSDSSATLYLHNLLNYFISGKSLAKPLQKISNFGVRALLSKIKASECIPIDISGTVNRGLRDKTARDGKGGWTDAGHSDFRQAPVGDNKFIRIPYKIINPDKNGNRAAIILKGGKTPEFPAQVKISNIDRKFRRLFFFHTSWYMKRDSKVMDYIINYADGSKTKFEIIAGKDIGDWYAPSDLANAAVAWSGKHPVINAPFGFYISPWDNPSPDKKITSIEIISNGDTTPIILGITGQANVDFASKIGHPWNFANSDNIAKEINLKPIKRQAGLYTFKLTTQHGWLGLNLYDNKVDAKKWKRLTFALKATNPVLVKVICFSPSGDNATCDGIPPIKKVGDWSYYDVDLENIKWRWGTSPEAKQWGGRDKTVVMLALDFTSKKGTVIDLKPVCLYQD